MPQPTDQPSDARRLEVARHIRAAREMLSSPSEQLAIDYLDHALFELSEIERRELPATPSS